MEFSLPISWWKILIFLQHARFMLTNARAAFVTHYHGRAFGAGVNSAVLDDWEARRRCIWTHFMLGLENVSSIQAAKMHECRCQWPFYAKKKGFVACPVCWQGCFI